MTSKYFKPGQNRSPDQRRQVRKLIDKQPISVTSEEGDQLPKNARGLTTNELADIETYQNLPQPAIGVVGVSIKVIGASVFGFLTIIGLIIGTISFFNSINEKLTENRMRIENTTELVDSNKQNLDEKIEKVESSLTDRIKELKEDISKRMKW